MPDNNALAQKPSHQPPPMGASATTPRRVLIIEDESEIAELVRLHLEEFPAHATVLPDGPRGLKEALTGSYDLIVLDVRLPGMNGLDVCHALRAKEVHTPVLILSAKAADTDRIVGLELGADDYLCKPFVIGELVARARALLRRTERARRPQPVHSEVIRVADLVIDPALRKVQAANREVALTPKEFDLLYLLADQRHRVFTRAQLLHAVWRSSYKGYEHTVNCHINRLRLKLERDPSDPRYIVTVWGVGYKFGA